MIGSLICLILLGEIDNMAVLADILVLATPAGSHTHSNALQHVSG